jgi:hypothetical protein
MVFIGNSGSANFVPSSSPRAHRLRIGGRKGTRNRVSILADALLDGEGETIVRNVIEKAKQGDPLAQRLCFDRLVPRRERPIPLDMPPINTPEDAKNAAAVVVQACACGDVSAQSITDEKRAWLATQWVSNPSPAEFPAIREFNREFRQ